ncbi:TniB family NTP-binding protein [Sphingomonas agri]|uniref:TniB family NTP-binding protein n=1 Tax=Sphingomonas agri TaxID=1813878 RepID=UPI00311DAD71
MDSIVIDNPRARAAHATFDFLVELSGHRPGEPKRCASLIAPAQTGKTTIIDSYVGALNTPDALMSGDIPALKVTLRANITRRQFAQDILEAFEAFGCNALVETGTEIQMLRRAISYLAARRVQILFLDEFHHLVHSDNRKVVVSVSETVKHLLITGSCPIVVAGLDEARRPFDANTQLAHRAEAHLDLSPLDPMSKSDIDLFFNFLTDYLIKTEQVGAAEHIRTILNGDGPACILEVSQGVLGAACNLVKEAVHVAAGESRLNVSRNDFTVAADRAVRNRLYIRNPFREGCAPIKRKKLAA